MWRECGGGGREVKAGATETCQQNVGKEELVPKRHSTSVLWKYLGLTKGVAAGPIIGRIGGTAHTFKYGILGFQNGPEAQRWR